MLLNRSNRILELNYEKYLGLFGLLLVQLGAVAKGHYRQLDTECLQHVCALALGIVHGIRGLEHHSHSGVQRHMVRHGQRKIR